MTIDALARLVARREVVVAVSAAAAGAGFRRVAAQISTEATRCEKCDADHPCRDGTWCKGVPGSTAKRCVGSDAIVCGNEAYAPCPEGSLFKDGECCTMLFGNSACGKAQPYCAAQ